MMEYEIPAIPQPSLDSRESAAWTATLVTPGTNGRLDGFEILKLRSESLDFEVCKIFLIGH
jgi:hypothetical protein